MAGSQPVEVYDNGNMNRNSVTMSAETTIVSQQRERETPRKGYESQGQRRTNKNNALR